jgi:hypothetical protein
LTAGPSWLGAIVAVIMLGAFALCTRTDRTDRDQHGA